MTPFSDEDFPTLETSDTYALWITWWFTLSLGCQHTVLGRCSWPHHPTIMYCLSITSPDVSFLHAISGLVNYIFLTLCGWVSWWVTYGRHPTGVTSTPPNYYIPSVFMSPDVSFLHAISGLVDYIFLTLWVAWLLITGTHPTGVTFFDIIYSNISMTAFSDEDFLTLETSDTCALWITWWITLSFGWLLMAGTPQGLLSLASYTVTFEWLPSVMKIFQPWKHLTHMHCESRGDSLFLSVAHIRSWEDVVDHTTQLLCTICLLSHLMSLSYMPSVVWSIISSWHCMWVGEWAGYLW